MSRDFNSRHIEMVETPVIYSSRELFLPMIFPVFPESDSILLWVDIDKNQKDNNKKSNNIGDLDEKLHQISNISNLECQRVIGHDLENNKIPIADID